MNTRRAAHLAAIVLCAGIGPWASAQPKLIITGLSSDMAASGNGVAGLANVGLTGPNSQYATVPMVWARGAGYTIIPGATFGGTSGIKCSADLTALSMAAPNTTNWGDLNCFAGYCFGAATNCTPGDPYPPPSPCRTPAVTHHWDMANGWVNAGSFDRILDPTTGRYYGGTRCDYDINQPNDLSGNGRYSVGGAWWAPLTRTDGSPGFGLCGDFYAFRHDAVTGVFEQLPVQPGTTTSRADYVNGDGSVITGYDLGIQELSGPMSVAIGEFNGDGIKDLAVCNNQSNSISVLLGNSDGTFQTRVNYSVPIGTLTSVAVGDLNGDTRPDLAVSGTQGVKVLTGNGDGTFTAMSGFPNIAGAGPRAVVIGDMNGDTRPDLVVANFAGGTVAVLIGNGDGTFQFGVNYNVGANPTSVALGHFDAGASLDVAVTNFGSGNVSVLLGNGNGTLQPAVNLGAGTNPSSVAVGRINADSFDDMVVANRGSDNVSVLLGNGDGTFQAAANFAAGSGPTGVAIGQMNAGTAADLVVSNFASNNVSVLLGNGNGTFQTATNSTAGSNPLAIAVGTLGTGSTLDVVTANFGSANVSVLLGNGDGTLQAAANYASGGGAFQSTRRTVVWRNGVQTVLDSYLGAKDNAAVNGPGTVLAQGASTDYVATTFPGEVGVRLIRWTLQGNTWVPQNLGRPADLVVDPGTGSTLPFGNLWATGVSDDGNTIVGQVEYGPPPPSIGGIRRPFIWRPTINEGVPMDLEAYIASIDSPTDPIFTPGLSMSYVQGLSSDGNAMLVTMFDGRNTCTPPAQSHVTFNAGVIYLDGSNIPCDPPHIGVGPEDWTDESGLPYGVSLNVVASGSWPLTYQWQREDPNAPGTWNNLAESCQDFTTVVDWDYEGVYKNQLRIGIGTGWASRAGNYRVVVSNSCGSIASDPATVAFNAGACCFPGGACILDFTINCSDFGNGGVFQGTGTTCTPTICAARACCIAETCAFVDPITCTANEGTAREEGSTCSPDPCTPSSGACCRGSTCATDTAANCTGANTSFSGAGTVCNAFGGNNTAPCCLADYNQSGAVTVQDIFDFLSGYFTFSPLADINASGSTTVQDIFDFLSAYFSGCP